MGRLGLAIDRVGSICSAGTFVAPASRRLSRGRLAHVRATLNECQTPCAINDCNAIIAIMASITIRNLEETTKRKLKVRAAINGRSMEQEAREILKSALQQKPKSGAEMVKHIRAIFEPLGGVDLEPYPRKPLGDPEWLKDWK
jgi:antitoxin FitA